MELRPAKATCYNSCGQGRSHEGSERRGRPQNFGRQLFNLCTKVIMNAANNLFDLTITASPQLYFWLCNWLRLFIQKGDAMVVSED